MSIVKKAITTITLSLGLIASANSAVIFSDNFDSENGGLGKLNYNTFSNWSVADGTVDLIGNGYFDFIPGQGLYIDLDGSTGNSGIMGHFETLLAGSYTLSFSLAGNHRNNATETTTASVSVLTGESLASQTFSLNRNDGFVKYSIDFNVSDLLAPASTNITFGTLSNDNIGMLLDDVILEKHATNVSEPASLALLGLGLIGLAAARRQKV